MDYDGTEVVETMVQTATVVADSGDDVKMRSTPSQTDGRIIKFRWGHGTGGIR